MAAGSTYTPIATQTLSSNQSSVTFSSIPSTYTDLILVISGSTTSFLNTGIQLNSDTGTNYSWTRIYGDGSAAASSRASNTSNGYVNDIRTSISTTIVHFQNYSNTTTYKTILSRDSGASGLVEAWVNLWRSTSAINSIYLFPGGSFAAGSMFTLYGIASA
jgi:hypothetical protein